MAEPIEMSFGKADSSGPNESRIRWGTVVTVSPMGRGNFRVVRPTQKDWESLFIAPSASVDVF